MFQFLGVYTLFHLLKRLLRVGIFVVALAMIWWAVSALMPVINSY